MCEVAGAAVGSSSRVGSALHPQQGDAELGAPKQCQTWVCGTKLVTDRARNDRLCTSPASCGPLVPLGVGQEQRLLCRDVS